MTTEAQRAQQLEQMKAGVLVYISGPMTAKDGRTMEQNTADGVAVYLDLLKRGIPAFSPHLSGAFPSAWSALDHQQWIDYDCAIIDRCTHLLMMPRWETSKGAVMEFDYAQAKGIPVAKSVEQLTALLAGADAIRQQAERASPSGLAAYRPQHHDGCDSFHCIRCGGRFGGDLRYTCRCIERRQPKPCSCGLDALLKSAEKET